MHPSKPSKSSQVATPGLVVGLVDPVRTARVLVDEVVSRGISCVIIDSGCVTAHPERVGCTTVKYQGDMPKLVAELRDLGVSQIIAGCDPVILFTDQLREALGVPTNRPGQSEARRDKGKMGAAMRQAGLRSPLEIQARTFEEIAAWLESIPMPVVIKPSDSGGTDDVYKCESVAEVEARFASIIGKTNLMGSMNHSVLVQEFIDGTEYIVDSVTFDGVHAFSDVLEYEKGTHNGRSFIYEKIRFLRSDEKISQRLMDFARNALDALGVEVGAGHMELKINSKGEIVFLEVGARLAGATIHTLAKNGRGDGVSQVQLMIDAVSGKSAPGAPYPGANSAVKVFIVTNQEGEISDFKNLERVKALRSFRDIELHAAVGDKLHKTTDLAHNVGMVDLAHADARVLSQDEGTLKQILSEGLFLLKTT